MFSHLDRFLTEKVLKEERLIKNAFEKFITSRPSDFFKKGIDALVSRWQKCIEANGEYFN